MDEVRADLTTNEITSSDLTGITTLITTGFYNKSDTGGRFWRFTSTTIPANAGITDFPNLHIYDINGRQYKLDEQVITPQALGAVADGVADDTLAIQTAIDTGNYRLYGTYGVGSSLVLMNTTYGVADNALITALDDDFAVFTAPGKRDFHLTGNLRIVGTNTGTGTGFDFFNAYAYKISGNIEIQNFTSYGVKIDGDVIAPAGLASYRGQQGHWSGLAIRKCGIGMGVYGRAEYVQIHQPTISQCTSIGVEMSAGNVCFVGGNVTDNQAGVNLVTTGTTNHLHGMFVGSNLNHNIDYNLQATDVTLGHTFIGCHFYGDSNLVGNIKLIRSSNIHIVGGVISATIDIDGDYSRFEPFNLISNNLFTGPFVQINSTNSGREKLNIRSNIGNPLDLFGIEDRARVGINADCQGSGGQSLASNTTETLIFTNERYDNRGWYNSANGVTTASNFETITISFNTQFSTPSGTFVDGFVGIFIDSTARGIFPITATNSANNSLSSTGQITIAVSGGQTIEIRANVETTAGTVTFTDAVSNVMSIYSTVG